MSDQKRPSLDRLPFNEEERRLFDMLSPTQQAHLYETIEEVRQLELRAMLAHYRLAASRKETPGPPPPMLSRADILRELLRHGTKIVDLVAERAARQPKPESE